MEGAADTLKRLTLELGGNDAGIVLPGTDNEDVVAKFAESVRRCRWVSTYVDEARAKGARIVTGGVRPEGPGFFYPLTVVADATDEMLLVKEEQFGPAIPIIKYRTVEEALTRANALDVGLGGSVWGNDPEEAAGWAARLECGTAWVNQHGGLHPLAPFGGVKCSGIGVEFNVDGLKEYTTIQVVNVAR